MVGVKDLSKNQGQEAVGMIQIKPDQDGDQIVKEVMETIQKEVEVRSWVSDLIVVPEMPHTGMGKIDYKQLAEDYEKEYRKALKLYESYGTEETEEKQKQLDKALQLKKQYEDVSNIYYNEFKKKNYIRIYPLDTKMQLHIQMI